MDALDEILRSISPPKQGRVIPALRIARPNNPPYTKHLPSKVSQTRPRPEVQKKTDSVYENPDGDFSWIA